LPVLVGSRLTVLETSELVLGTPDKLKVQAVFLKEVLPAASARKDREEGIVLPTRVVFLRIQNLLTVAFGLFGARFGW
jgi:hypothetical protein